MTHTSDTTREAIDQWLRQVAELLGTERLSADAQRNLRALTQAWLRRLDVVTREEFEAQQAVLARTRARLEDLEQQVAELEQLDRERANNR